MLLFKSIFAISIVVGLTLFSSIFFNRSLLDRAEAQNSIESQLICKSPIESFAIIDLFTNTGKYLSCLPSVKKSPISKVNKHMKIKFRQSGGYAGLRLGCELDTNLLPVDESNRLNSLVENSDLLNLNSTRTKNSADLINYEIILETEAVKHQVTFDDLTIPEKILPLLDYLQSQAQPLN